MDNPIEAYVLLWIRAQLNTTTCRVKWRKNFIQIRQKEIKQGEAKIMSIPSFFPSLSLPRADQIRPVPGQAPRVRLYRSVNHPLL